MCVMLRLLAVAITSLYMIGCSPGTHDVRPDLRGLYQSARAIEGALGVGVAYGDFGTLIRDMSKELVLARDRAKYGSATVDPQLARLLDKYQSGVDADVPG